MLSGMNAILIDDEPLALERMKQLLAGQAAKDGGIIRVLAFEDWSMALEAAAREELHVAFIDIQMPEISGFELAERLLQLHPHMQIVFVTAYQEYAVKAFEVNALDYLMKPVGPQRLSVALRRAAEARKRIEAARSDKPAMICCLQSLRYKDRDGNIRMFAWRTYKAAELFAYMIHYRGKTVGKQELIDLLWPEYDTKRATAQLHTAVYQIRKIIDAAGLDLQIIYADRGYRLAWGSVALDLEEWENNIKQAPPVRPDTLELHMDIIGQYDGDYLEDQQYTWADYEQYRIRFLWLKHVREVADCYAGIREYHHAEQLYRQMIVRMPDAEDGYFGLMKICAELQYDNEVRKLYAQVSGKLKEELDIEPSPELAEWYRRWYEDKQAMPDISI